jgi:hypothetical protein
MGVFQVTATASDILSATSHARKICLIRVAGNATIRE